MTRTQVIELVVLCVITLASTVAVFCALAMDAVTVAPCPESTRQTAWQIRTPTGAFAFRRNLKNPPPCFPFQMSPQYLLLTRCSFRVGIVLDYDWLLKAMRLFSTVLLVLGAVAAGLGLSHIWAANQAPSGPTTHFERGKTSADFEEPAPVPTVLAEARKPAKRGTSGAASAAFDGRWSVVIGTRSGPCDPQYRFGVRIINGNITYEGGGAGNAQGRVLPSGSVTVSVASGPNAASGQGRLTRNYGTGSWRGQGPGGVCSGAWQAWRQ
jgi:hypothetical protein